jgi:uncharacterized protein YbjT (DUF2867 family)
MAKLITVFGATGAQGGPVARALLKNGFKVRAVTRNPDGEKGQALKDAGAEVVKGNIDDSQSVRTAIQGADGVFYVTNFWELFFKDHTTAYESEIKQGKTVADVCKALGTKHIVYSGEEPVKEKIGKDVPHYDSKAEVEKYLDEIGLPNTSVRYPFYFENFISFFPPSKQKDGTLAVTLPMDGPMDAISVADGAHILLAVFQNPQEYLGKKVGISGDKKPVADYVASISNVVGKTVRYNQISFDEFRNQPNNPAADEMANSFEFFSYGSPSYNEQFTRKVYPGVLSFQQWAEKNKDVLIKTYS